MFSRVMQLIVGLVVHMSASATADDVRDALVSLLTAMATAVSPVWGQTLIKLALAFIQSSAWPMIWKMLEPQVGSAFACASAGESEVLPSDLEISLQDHFSAIEASIA